MERTPQEGELQHAHIPPLPPYEQTLPQTQESPDEQIIRQGIEQAQHNGTDIDDRTARYIASHLHEGQASALYSLASTGIIAETVQSELTRNFDQQTDQVITCLSAYCLNRENNGSVPGWAESAAALDQAESTTAINHAQARAQEQQDEQEHEQARQDLMHRISAASTTTLGSLATITTVSNTSEHTTADDQPEHHHEYDDQEQDEHDTFSWTDAARWSPDSRDDELARDRLDVLFTEIPDQEIGTVEDIGWFGLLKHEGRPGGIVLSQNAYGFRHVWQTNSDEQLAQHWEQLQREYDARTLERLMPAALCAEKWVAHKK